MGDPMFKTARMLKFRVIIPQRVQEKVVGVLHEAGVVQIKEISELEVVRRALGKEAFELSSLIAKFKEMEEFLGPPTGKPITVKELTFEQTVKLARKSLEKIEPRVKQIKEKCDRLAQQHQSLTDQIKMLEDFKELEFPLEYLRSTDEIHITVGRIALEEVKEFIGAVEEALAQRVFTSTIGVGKRRIVIVACRTRDHHKLLPVLYRYEVEPVEIPPFSGSPATVIKEIKKQLADIERQKRDLKQSIKKLSIANAAEVSRLRELLEIQRERIECSGLFGYTEATVAIEGWVRKKQATDLENMLSAVTGGHLIFRTYEPQRAEVEITPVELENPKVVRDFEFITGMYGLPKYDEVDPTPLLTFTFALFFGIAMSDVGYGIALVIFMASGFRLAKIFPPKLRRTMIVCGLFTILMGSLIGGCFGFGEGIWVNPIKRPIPLLKLVIFIGIAHLLVAFGLGGGLKDIFRREWKSLVLGRISAILIIIGFFSLSFCVLGIGLYEFGIDFAFPKTEMFAAFNPLAPAPNIVILSRILLYLGLGMGILGAALTAKGVREKIGGAVSVIYGITGYIADAASYTRLLALGIATGVIAFSINLILALMYRSVMPAEITPLSALYAVPLLIFLALAFVAAHFFNIFINSLGSFIHTMRLHFAEFFGKFYESGGEKFSPFKAKRVFTKVKGGGWLGR